MWGVIAGDTVDYPVGNYYKRLLSHNIAVPVKIIAILLAIWLLNVFFVASHEMGHAAIADHFGANIYKVYISPLGADGSTTHAVLPDRDQADLVLAGGILTTTALTIVAYCLRFELAVYVLGIRTTESLMNYTQGSDMSTLMASMGTDTYAISMTLIAVTVVILAMTVNRRFTAIKMANARKRAAAVSAASA